MKLWLGWDLPTTLCGGDTLAGDRTSPGTIDGDEHGKEEREAREVALV